MRKRKYPVTLKIQYGHYRRSIREIRRIPVIRLGGNYLEEMGFNIGDTVNVVMVSGMIMITKA